MTRRQAFSSLFGLGAIGAGTLAVTPSHPSQPAPNRIAVNGTADREFARLLAREISRGGSLRAEWRSALK